MTWASVLCCWVLASLCTLQDFKKETHIGLINGEPGIQVWENIGLSDQRELTWDGLSHLEKTNYKSVEMMERLIWGTELTSDCIWDKKTSQPEARRRTKPLGLAHAAWESWPPFHSSSLTFFFWCLCSLDLLGLYKIFPQIWSMLGKWIPGIGNCACD